MARSTIYLLVLAICAIGAAFWYRQQLLPDSTPPSSVRLAFVTGGSGPFWQLTAQGARAAAEKHQCELSIEMPKDDESLEQQMRILSGLGTEQLDGIALSPLDSEGQTQLINRLQQKVNVATFDADAPLSMRRIHVGTSNYGAGSLCAHLVVESIPDGGKILVLLANLTKDNMIDRKSGFEETLTNLGVNAEDDSERPDFTVVGYKTDLGSNKKVQENIGNAFDSRPELACIVGMNARHGPVILKTLKELGKLGQVKVVAFDDQKETLDGIEEGHIYATIAQDPYMYGFEAVRMLTILERDGESDVPLVGGGTVSIPTEAIRKSELADFRFRLKDRIKDKSSKSEKEE